MSSTRGFAQRRRSRRLQVHHFVESALSTLLTSEKAVSKHFNEATAVSSFSLQSNSQGESTVDLPSNTRVSIDPPCPSNASLSIENTELVEAKLLL